jgi:hypothetical protein
MGEVIDINKAREKQKKARKNNPHISDVDWSKLLMQKNEANKERIKKDREKANKSVIRSYRL